MKQNASLSYLDTILLQHPFASTLALLQGFHDLFPRSHAPQGYANRLVRRAIRRLTSTLTNEGTSFAKSLEAHPKIFPPLYTNMVAAGEASGTLEAVLEDSRAKGFTASEASWRNVN